MVGLYCFILLFFFLKKIMANRKLLYKASTITSISFLSSILLTSTILMTMPTADAYEPKPQMWFSSSYSKDLPTFLDKEKYEGYAWQGKVMVMIYAPGWNEDPDKLDSIGTSEDTPIGVIVRNNVEGNSGAVKSLSPCGFLETGPDTGLFYGKVKLSGYDLDTNGDGEASMAYGKSACGNLQPGERAPHREAAKIESTQSGALTVWWQYNEEDDQVISRSATYTMTEAEVEFDQESYDVTDRVVVNLDESDIKCCYQAMYVKVYSDSDKSGIQLSYDKKTNPEIVYLTTTDDSAGQRLFVQPGDTIYAEYHDYTMPAYDDDGIKYDIGTCHSKTNCDASDHKIILATAKINNPNAWLD